MIPKRISNKRRQMGEAAWAEHVRLRKNKKSDAWQERNIENVVKWRQKHKIRLIEYKGVACLQTGRKFIGIENNPNYFDVAYKRLEEKLKKERRESSEGL